MELLAHIAAPSSRRDDDRYRRQAQACADFEPVNTVALSDAVAPSASATATSQESDSLALARDANSRADASTWTPPAFLENTQLALTALESQLITSSLGQAHAFLGDSIRPLRPKFFKLRHNVPFTA